MHRQSGFIFFAYQFATSMAKTQFMIHDYFSHAAETAFSYQGHDLSSFT